mmetsp:Transcript_36306/g.87612  ORF Transcript_36306/g.87612 Transcript_36306/m.87612 type:complete len:144 (-) Transcript_36306:695-1126(-)
MEIGYVRRHFPYARRVQKGFEGVVPPLFDEEIGRPFGNTTKLYSCLVVLCPKSILTDSSNPSDMILYQPNFVFGICKAYSVTQHGFFLVKNKTTLIKKCDALLSIIAYLFVQINSCCCLRPLHLKMKLNDSCHSHDALSSWVK